MWSWKISRVDWKIESIIIFSSPLSFVSVDNQCERPKLRKTSRIARLAVHWQYYDCRKSKIQSFCLNGNQQFGRLLIADCSGHCSQKCKRTKAGWKAWRDCRNLGLNLFVSADLRAAVTFGPPTGTEDTKSDQLQATIWWIILTVYYGWKKSW